MFLRSGHNFYNFLISRFPFPLQSPKAHQPSPAQPGRISTPDCKAHQPSQPSPANAQPSSPATSPAWTQPAQPARLAPMRQTQPSPAHTPRLTARGSRPTAQPSPAPFKTWCQQKTAQNVSVKTFRSKTLVAPKPFTMSINP